MRRATFTIHPATPADKAAWQRMRERLWPSEDHVHGSEIDQYFAGALNEPLEVLIATDGKGEAIGFVELSIRNYAEDCETNRVAYLEGWYVEPHARRLGAGRALVQSAEEWGRRQGCTEFGSDALIDNDVSAAAHRALGFEETVQIRCFRKPLGTAAEAPLSGREDRGRSSTATQATDLSRHIGKSLAEHLRRVRARIHALVDPLSTDELWRRPYPYGNSIGHLLLHLTGNLSYYIGTEIACTGYVRDRPGEFADPSKMPKEETLRRFDAAVDLVLATLARQSDSDWEAAYEGVGADDKNRLSIFIRCVAHADHHAGQIIYLAKELARR